MRVLISVLLSIISAQIQAHPTYHTNAISLSCAVSKAEGWKSNAISEDGKEDRAVMKDQIERRIKAMEKLKDRIKNEYYSTLECLDSELNDLHGMKVRYENERK